MEAMVVVHDGLPLRFEIFPTSYEGGAGQATEYERNIDWEVPYRLASSVTGKLGFPPPRMRGRGRRRSSSGRCGDGGGGGGGDGGKGVEEAEEGELIRAIAQPGITTLLRAVEHLELGIPLEPYIELGILGRPDQLREIGIQYTLRGAVWKLPKPLDPPLLTQPSAPLRLYFPPPIRAHPFTLVTHNRYREQYVLHTTALSFPDPLPLSVCVDPADAAGCDDRKKGRWITSRWGRSYGYVAPSSAKRDHPRVVAISRDPHRAFRGGGWPANMVQPRWDLSSRPTLASPLPSKLMGEVIITSILLKLPVKTLLRLKCVSRQWRELITGRDFLVRHVELATRKSQLLQGRLPLLLSPDVLVLIGLRQSLNLYSYTLGEATAQHLFEKVFPEKNCDSCHAVLRHCNGLLLHATATLIYVCNPSTGEAVTLPRGSLGVGLYEPDNVTLGFDPSTREYKVVRYFYRSIAAGSRAANVGCQVFTLGSSSGGRPCWELTTEDPPCPPMGGSPAFLDGVACWKVNNQQHGGSPQAFVSLDLKNGKFRVLPPPPGFSSLDDRLRDETIITQVDGRLCLFELPSYSNNKPSVELWALDGTRQFWVSMYVFHLQHPASPKDFLPLASHDEKVVVKTPHGLSYYSPESWEFEAIVDVGPMNTCYDQGYLTVVGRRCLGYFYVAPFVESLVSPGGDLREEINSLLPGSM